MMATTTSMTTTMTTTPTSWKSSFDRFGDDMATEILRYLTTEDHIRLACVSKQFLDCGLRLRRSLTFDQQILQRIPPKSYHQLYYNSRTVWLALANKCPDSIHSIDIRSFGYLQTYIVKAIGEVRQLRGQQQQQLWPRLRRLDCDLNYVSRESMGSMMATSADLVNEMRFDWQMSSQLIENIKQYVPKMSRLRHWSVESIDDVFGGDGHQLLATGLQSFSCELICNGGGGDDEGGGGDNNDEVEVITDDTLRFKTFIDGNTSLTSLRLTVQLRRGLAVERVATVLATIGQLTALRRLTVHLDRQITQSMAKSLELIGQSCPDLRWLDYKQTTESVATYFKTYSAVKQQWKQLRRLSLRLYLLNNDDGSSGGDPDANRPISSDRYESLAPSANSWPELKHLTLQLSHYDYRLFGRRHFGQNLPKLEYLAFTDIDSKLWPLLVCNSGQLMPRSLKTLNYSVNLGSNVIGDSDGVRKLLADCRQLKSLTIDCYDSALPVWWIPEPIIKRLHSDDDDDSNQPSIKSFIKFY